MASLAKADQHNNKYGKCMRRRDAYVGDKWVTLAESCMSHNFFLKSFDRFYTNLIDRTEVRMKTV